MYEPKEIIFGQLLYVSCFNPGYA